MKIMSVIGICWFSLSFICIVGLIQSNMEAAAGWGIIASLYAIPYSIVGLVVSSKKSENLLNITLELTKLNELKEKNIITEEEFQTLKSRIIKN
jgi:hypothetical protein